jgi:hypothetical protein
VLALPLLQPELDLRPGLAAFANWWLSSVAFAEFQDTGGEAGFQPAVLA